MNVQVVFCGRNEENGEAVAKEFNATFTKVDVTDAAQVESFFNQVNHIILGCYNSITVKLGEFLSIWEGVVMSAQVRVLRNSYECSTMSAPA